MKKLNTPYKKNHSMSKIKTYHIKFPYVYERRKSDEKYEIKKNNENEIKENRYFIQKKIILNNIK